MRCPSESRYGLFERLGQKRAFVRVRFRAGATRAHWPTGLGPTTCRWLGVEYVKIAKNAAIANAQDVDQSPSMAPLTRTASASVDGDGPGWFQGTSQCCVGSRRLGRRIKLERRYRAVAI